jgi:methylase of polypeptide subunit release factors
MWLQLPEAVRSGRPVHDVTPEQTEVEYFHEFVPALFPANEGAALALASKLRIAERRSPTPVVDLAAGSGVWGISLAQKSRTVEVTAVDWEGVIPVTRQMAERFGVQDRFRFVTGDLLQTDFGGDYSIAILGHVLHGWSEKDGTVLIAKTFHALAAGALLRSRNGW